MQKPVCEFVGICVCPCMKLQLQSPVHYSLLTPDSLKIMFIKYLNEHLIAVTLPNLAELSLAFPNQSEPEELSVLLREIEKSLD